MNGRVFLLWFSYEVAVNIRLTKAPLRVDMGVPLVIQYSP